MIISSFNLTFVFVEDPSEIVPEPRHVYVWEKGDEVKHYKAYAYDDFLMCYIGLSDDGYWAAASIAVEEMLE